MATLAEAPPEDPKLTPAGDDFTPLFQDNPTFGRLALDPGRLNDVFRATSHLVGNVYGAIDRMVNERSTEPHDVLTGLSLMMTGGFGRALGGTSEAELGAFSGRLGKANSQTWSADMQNFVRKIDVKDAEGGRKSVKALVQEFRQRYPEYPSSDGTIQRQINKLRLWGKVNDAGEFELGAMGGLGRTPRPGETIGPPREFTTSDVVDLLKEIGATDIQVKKAKSGAGTEYVKFQPPGNPTKPGGTPVIVRLPQDPRQHIGLPPKISEEGNLFDTGVHLARTAAKPADPASLMNAAGETYSQWEALEAAIKWRTSAGRDGQFLIAPEQAPLYARMRTAEEAAAPRHPTEGADYHPDQLKLLASGDHVPLTVVTKSLQGKPSLEPADKPYLEPADIDHTSMFDRIMNGGAAMRVLKEMGQSFNEGAGDLGEIGIRPGGVAEKYFRDIGVFVDPNRPQLVDAVRAVEESGIRLGAAVGDTLMKMLNGAVFATAGGISQIAEEAGYHPSHKLKYELADTTNFLLAVAPTLAGAGPHPLTRVKVGPDGKPMPDAIGTLPKRQDFEVAARGLTDGDAQPIVKEKLHQIYEEYGVHPAEVLADARHDPKLMADLLDDTTAMLPARYTGVDPAKLTARQIEDGIASGTRQPPISGISAHLNEALETRVAWPETPISTDPRTPTGPRTFSMRFGEHVGRLIDRMGLADTARDLQMKLTPMAERDASVDSRAAAKDFANSMRVARYDGQTLHRLMTEEFPPDRLKAMWEAADLESVALMEGKPSTAMAALSPTERAVVKKLQTRAADAWEDAKLAGVVKEDAKPIPSYVPRMVVNTMKEDGAFYAASLDPAGRNLRTTTNQLRRRNYLTVEETEAAAKRALGEGAEVVRDIRTLSLATARLQEATGGKRLINRIRELGDQMAEGTVLDGAPPKDSAYTWFTIDHPAFKVNRPMVTRNAKGQLERVKLEDGTPAFERQPLYVRGDFEGPLRAVLTEPEGAVYRALMSLKSKATSMIMYSPLLHNAVIFARVMPAANGNPVAAARMYFEGNRVKNNPTMMRQAIGDGMVPIGRGGAAFDISSITGELNIEPGRSITSQVLAFVPNLFDRNAGSAVKAAVDKAGDFWHNTLLWDRVGDMQAGLYKHYLDDQTARGVDPQTASRAAAHLANRYAGVLTPEAMSHNARKLANVMLFSRSFTLGNIGSMKDMFAGLPRDVLAQIERDRGFQEMGQIRSALQRKSIGIVAIDTALFYAGNSVLQSAIKTLRGDTTLGEEGQEYLDRFWKTLQRTAANPFEAMNPFGFLHNVESLASTAENEPGKEKRIFVGYQSDGTALYLKNPLGKTGEEMIGWMTEPGQMVKNKLSTTVKPGLELWQNQDFAGRKIYNPYAHTTEEQVRNLARMTWHYMKAQFPSDAVEAAADLLHGTPTPDEARIDTLKMIGPLMGLMFSQGAPGGPAIGEMMRAKQEQAFRIQEVLPGARKAIKEDRMDEAIKLMTDAQINPKLQKFFIDTTLNPSMRIARRSMRELLLSLPLEQQERVQRQLDRGNR